MAESIVQVTEGTGKKLHTNQRTIGGNNVEDEFVLLGEYPLATSSVTAVGVSLATATDHLLQLMAGASLNVRVRKIKITMSAATAVTTARIDVLRLTTAGTGGTAVTARPFDTADTPGATAITIPGVKGTEGVTLYSEAILIGSATLPFNRPFEWTATPNEKGILIPAGITNGIVLKNQVAVAGCTASIVVEFVETSFAG